MEPNQENQIKETLGELIRNAEPDILAYLNQDDWRDIVHDIVIKYDINPGAEEGIKDEIILMLLNASSWELFKVGVEARIQKDSEVVDKVADEVNEFIFKPVGIGFANDNKTNMSDDTINKVATLLNTTPEEATSQIENLPNDIKQTINSFELTQTIKGIADIHHLHVDQTGALANETTLYLIGKTRPSALIDNIAKKLHISGELAKNITRDLNEQIFKKFKDSLQQVQGFTPNQEENQAENEPVPSNQTQKSESDTTTTLPPRNVFDEKMSSLFKTTKTEEEISDKPRNLDQKTDKEPPRHDPYRESVE